MDISDMLPIYMHLIEYTIAGTYLVAVHVSSNSDTVK